MRPLFSPSFSLIVFASISTLSLAGFAWAAEPPPAKPAEPAPAADKTAVPEAQAKPAATAEENKTAEQAPPEEKSPQAKPPAERKASPQRFIPSEQVRADFDVSFPIDI